MSSSKKIITVVGATGLQGSSVVNTFLPLENWHVRALTRNMTSEKAQALAAAGVEVVQADLSDAASLARAFENSHAIFLNTTFWETYAPLIASGVPPSVTSKQAWEAEVSNGKNAANAAASVPTLERLVYSALPSPKKASNGKYRRSGHAEAKGEIVNYVETELPELAKKTSYLYLGAYNTNPLLYPKLDPRSGQYTTMLPTKKIRMPIVDPKESTGPFVRTLVEDEAPGIKLLGYDEDSNLVFDDIIAIWTGVTGKDVVVLEMSTQEISKLIGVDMEILEMIDFVAEYGYSGGVDGMIEPSQLKNKPTTKSWQQWLKERDVKELLGQ
ncbi:NAD(P)-binding protein [Thozetella sp. PMI_491]|nr:NAD(P)-binding protein [Thozetella sp. PMI_491]